MVRNRKLIAMLMLTFAMGILLTLCILKVIPKMYWFITAFIGIADGRLIGEFWKEYWE